MEKEIQKKALLEKVANLDTDNLDEVYQLIEDLANYVSKY